MMTSTIVISHQWSKKGSRKMIFLPVVFCSSVLMPNLSFAWFTNEVLDWFTWSQTKFYVCWFYVSFVILNFLIFTSEIIPKQKLFASGSVNLPSGSVNIPLDFVSGNIRRDSPRLRRIIVKYEADVKNDDDWILNSTFDSKQTKSNNKTLSFAWVGNIVVMT